MRDLFRLCPPPPRLEGAYYSQPPPPQLRGCILFPASHPPPPDARAEFYIMIYCVMTRALPLADTFVQRAASKKPLTFFSKLSNLWVIWWLSGDLTFVWLEEIFPGKVFDQSRFVHCFSSRRYTSISVLISVLLFILLSSRESSIDGA